MWRNVWLSASLVLGGLVVTACSADDDISASADAPTTAPHSRAAIETRDANLSPTSSAPPTTTTTASPEVSYDGSVPPPPLVQEGTDFYEIVESYIDYLRWLRAHNPDPTLVEQIAPLDSEAGTRLQRELTLLRDHGYRFYETDRSFWLGGTPGSPDVRQFYIHFKVQGIGKLFNAEGEIVQTTRLPFVERYEMRFELGDDGKWRLLFNDVPPSFTDKESA